MSTPKTCTIVVGVEKTGRHLITRCGKPATHRELNSTRRFCADHAKEFAFNKSITPIHAKATK